MCIREISFTVNVFKMISNLDSHHEAWSSTLSDLKICPTENVKVATHRLENIAGEESSIL